MPILDTNIGSSAAIAWSKIATSTAITAGDIGSSQILDRHLSSKLRTGSIPIALHTARVRGSTAGEDWLNASGQAAGILTSASSPALQAVSTANRGARIVFSSGTSPLIQFEPITPPADMSSNSSATLKFWANSLGSTDAGPLFSFSFFNGLGASASPVTQAVSSAAKSTAISTFSVAVPVSTYATLNPITIQLGAVSTEDKTALYGLQFRYARQSTA